MLKHGNYVHKIIQVVGRDTKVKREVAREGLSISIFVNRQTLIYYLLQAHPVLSQIKINTKDSKCKLWE